MYKVADTWSRQATANSYASRAAYKLLAINSKFRLLRPNQTVVDLGASPGSFSQVAAQCVAPHGRVVAIDLQPLTAQFAGPVRVHFEQADVLQWRPEPALVGRVDVVLSDLMSATSGVSELDTARSSLLCLRALALARALLPPGGACVAKLFAGSSQKEILEQFRTTFEQVQYYKPPASRSNSRETFIVARNKKP